MLSKVVKLVAIAFSIFTITLPLYPLDALAARSVHLGFVFFLVFVGDCLLKEEDVSVAKLVFYTFCTIVTVGACFYLWKESQPLQLIRMGMYNKYDLIVGVIVLVGVLISTRKYYGWTLIVIVAFFLLYMMYGEYLPSVIGHPGVSRNRMISNLTLATEGIFGSPLGAVTSTVAIFIIFAAFLEVSTGFKLFMELAMFAFGRFVGGAAKVAVVGSTLFGMISGSAAANTAAVGLITIPMMKKAGFEPHVAGAIEAASGSGGQIMPPIMGAAAFVMAEMLSISYGTVMGAAIIPALCYYIAIFMSVDLYSRKHNIRSVKESDLGDTIGEKKILTKREMFQKSLLLLPIISLFIFIGAFNLSPQYSALLSTVMVLICAFPNKETRFTFKKVLEALEKGSLGVLSIAVVCAASGIIIGVFTVTGVGLKLSSALIALSGGKLIFLLILAMIASLILGMGVPTVAAYLILAILVAPAMVKFGVLPIAAHMFVFYFGIISAITPPVAIAAYVGAGIAGASPVKVGYTACKIALPAFIVPYIFVYSPALMLQGDSLLQILEVGFTTLLGAFLCSIATQQYMFRKLNVIETLGIAICTILVMIPEFYTDIIGIIGACLILIPIYLKTKKKKGSAAV